MTLFITPWIMQQALVGVAAGSFMPGPDLDWQGGWTHGTKDSTGLVIAMRSPDWAIGPLQYARSQFADPKGLDDARTRLLALQEQPAPGRQHTGPIDHVIEVRDPKNVVGTIVDESEPSAPPVDIKTADDLLLALQFADKDLKTLRAGVMFDKLNDAMGDRQVRIGTLWFVTDAAVAGGAPARRRFAVHFSKLQFDGRVREEDQHLLFDGEWFIEKLTTQKQFKKRQVVPAGQMVDPLKIGEGPFPIPIGQKRAEILKRYSAELLPATEGVVAQENEDAAKQQKEQEGLIDFVSFVTTRVKDPVTGVLKEQKVPATFYQLKLTLRPEYQDQESLREVRLWYRELSSAEGAASGGQGVRMLLPRMARTVNRAGDVSIVQLTNVKVNEPVEAGVMDTTPPTDPSWEVTVEPLE
ncbi:MAG TPA: hypothetical protein VHN77_02520 [Phycisphaerales bacterium]|nr:hypothetical protein [Phycisphaerales bacterium]